MPSLYCYVSTEDMAELKAEAERSGRQVQELAEAAISNACCEARSRRPRERDADAPGLGL